VNGGSTPAAEQMLEQARRSLNPASGVAERVREGVQTRVLSELSAASREGSSSPPTPLLAPLTEPVAGARRAPVAFGSSKLVLLGAALGIIGFWLVLQVRQWQLGQLPLRHGWAPGSMQSASAPHHPAPSAAATASSAEAGPDREPPATLARPASGETLETRTSQPARPQRERARRPAETHQAKRVASASSPVANVRVELTLREVLALLQRAEAARVDGRLGDASEILSEIDQRAPPALLVEERLTAGVLIACSMGDQPRALRLAERLNRENRATIYAGRLTESCVAARAERPASTR
jgi:hypothetical protein